MAALILRRLAFMIPTAVLVSVMVFSLVLLIPGDAAQTIAGADATQEEVQQLREQLGADAPLVVQYGRWVTGAVRGDFGDSLITGRNVRASILDRLPASLSLAVGALVVTILLGVTIGLLAAAFQDTWADRVLMASSSVPIAFPNYFLGMLLVLAFAVWNRWLPASQYVRPTADLWAWVEHLVLPSVALGMAGAAVVARQLRTSMVRVLEQDYVRTARAKGLSSTSVILKHALKNASIPVVTILVMQLAALMGGTVIIEQVFGIPGLGALAINSVVQRDLPMIQGVVVFTTVIVLVVNLFADVLYGWLNPRIRIG